MTDMAEHDALAERFAALATRDSGDWSEVRGRARRMQLGRAALVAAAGLVAVVLAAPALGLHRSVVDWLEAERAGGKTQLEFLQLGMLGPRGLDPRVIPNSARKVTTIKLSDGRTTTLVVGPTKSGGFCWLWIERTGGCVFDRTASYPRIHPRIPGLNAMALAAGLMQSGSMQMVNGRLLDVDIERLVLEYENGETSVVPVVWVSEPIDAGFYFFEVPERHRVARRAKALVGHDGDGKVVARHEFRYPAPEDVERGMLLPNGERVVLPANALVERARKIIDLPSADGKTRMTAWIVPRADGRECYLVYNSGGCPPAGLDMANPVPGLDGGNRVVVSGRVRDDVARYRLRYEDGAVELVEPIEGFVIHELPASRYPRGKRLVLIQALDAEGNVVARERFEPNSPGVYPCKKPVDQGYGFTACP